MIILALDSSSKVCSAAVMKDSVITAELSVNNGLVHSRTLLPLAEQAMELSGVSAKDIDVFACVAGPGSFTGVRIAVSAVKALAQPWNKPCVAVNTLQAAAENIMTDGLVCPILDARCGQVYGAVYSGGNALLPCDALPLSQLCEFIRKQNAPCVFTGDGVDIHKSNIIAELGDNALFAPPALSFQRAGTACAIAEREFESRAVSCFELDALYLRKPQAEREYNRNHEV